MPPAELGFLRAVGRQVGAFRDALTEYALSVKASGAVKTPDFVVTPAMRDDLWHRMTARKITMDRGAYEAAEQLVTRQLTYEIARYVFGPDVEFRRRAADDPVINAALAITHGTHSQHDLFARAPKSPPTHG